MPEVGEVAERSNATDCKSVALVASEVRILPSPPAFARRSWAGDSKPVEAGYDRGEADERRGLARVDAATNVERARREGGSNSVVESQPSKLLVAGSIPVSRSTILNPDVEKDRET